MRPRCEFLPDNEPWQCLITTGALDSSGFELEIEASLGSIKSAVDRGVSIVQIREKNLSAGNVHQFGERVVKLCRNSKTKVLVNDRFDIALSAGADGVHLTSNSIPTEIVRGVCPSDFIVGVSTHSFEEALAAQSSGADFVHFGPVFDTPSKRVYGEPMGIEKLRDTCRKLNGFPVVAVGGIDGVSKAKVLEAGAVGFAAIRYFASRDGKNR